MESADDFFVRDRETYSRVLAVSGWPLPEVELVTAPAGSTLEGGPFTYTLVVPIGEPEPASFTITLEATNSEGTTERGQAAISARR